MPPASEPRGRTAQRKARTPNPSPAATPNGAAAAAGPAGEAPLPPLPGEEETSSGPATGNVSATQQRPAGDDTGAGPDDTDYDTPGTANTPQITAIWTVLSTIYHFGKDEKEQARAVCAHIIGRDLASTKDMSRNEAKTVLNTLAHWQKQATDKGDEPRDYLIAVMVAEEAAHDGE